MAQYVTSLCVPCRLTLIVCMFYSALNVVVLAHYLVHCIVPTSCHHGTVNTCVWCPTVHRPLCRLISIYYIQLSTGLYAKINLVYNLCGLSARCRYVDLVSKVFTAQPAITRTRGTPIPSPPVVTTSIPPTLPSYLHSFTVSTHQHLHQCLEIHP